MSPLPNRSSHSSESPAPHQSPLPDDQVANPLESPVENTVDNPPDSATNTATPASTPEAPQLVLKRPVMRPVSPAEPPESQSKPVETKAPQPERGEQFSKPAGQSQTPIETVQAAGEPSDASVAVSAEGSTGSELDSPETTVIRQHPIPAPSEPMQYRAIGLIRGRYTPSEEQFTRGQLLTTDQVEIEAVLLGRVMSLVKNHLDLTQDHLWVVYPRTREKEEDLHAQIVGVWEPEKLNKELTQDEELSDDQSEDEDNLDEEEEMEASSLDSSEIEDESEASDEIEAQDADEEDADEQEIVESASPSSTETVSMPQLGVISSADVEDNYFSIRGEVIFQSPETNELIIKINQIPRKKTQKAKAFKLKLNGALAGRAVGYFWDLHVRREDRGLVVYEATSIGLIPPKKRKGGNGGGGGRKPFNRSGRPGGGGGSRKPMKPRSFDGGGGKPPESSSSPRRPVPKPVKRREPTEGES
jgi:hypothetical protein